MLLNNTVLLVHYNPEDLKRMSAWAEEMGLRPVTARNRDQAVSLMEQQTIHLILLDPLLPGACGFTTARQLAEKRPETPVIVATCMYRKIQMEQAGQMENMHMIHLDAPLNREMFETLVLPATVNREAEKEQKKQEAKQSPAALTDSDSFDLGEFLSSDPDLQKLIK